MLSENKNPLLKKSLTRGLKNITLSCLARKAAALKYLKYQVM